MTGRTRDTGTIKIAGLADVALGYGFPQLESMLESLAEHFAPAQAVVIEPDMKDRRRLHTNSKVDIRRFGTRMPPYEDAFRIEYNMAIREFLRQERPEVLVIVNAEVMPAVLTSGYRPKLIIYYFLEALSHQLRAGGELFLDLNLMFADYVDLIVVPESNRATYDLYKLGWRHKPCVEVLNVNSRPPARRAVPKNRTGQPRFLYAGTVSTASQCEYFEMLPDTYQIDIAGPCYTDDARRLTENISNNRRNIRYLGLLTTDSLNAIRDQYDYSIVMWRPTDVNHFYASPNKLFETIAARIPPVVAPHPQCADLMDRYGCGVLMRDWSFGAFQAALDDAVDLYGEDLYEALCDGCDRAFDQEANWPAQFAKLRPLLPRRTALARVERAGGRVAAATR